MLKWYREATCLQPVDIKPNYKARNSGNFTIKVTYCRLRTALIIQRLNRREKKMLGAWRGEGVGAMRCNTLVITREWVESG